MQGRAKGREGQKEEQDTRKIGKGTLGRAQRSKTN